jgi:hypothetical protein
MKRVSKKDKAAKNLKTMNLISSAKLMNKVCIAVPTTGLLRVEWVMARYGCVIPVNWSNGDMFQFVQQDGPHGYCVADARNICIEYFISGGFEWLFFNDQDTCLPSHTFLKIGEYMREGKYPVVCGLYYCKGTYPEPLIFRGRGNGYFDDWKFGDKVMVDGIPMGCTLIHRSVLKLMYDESEVYSVPSQYGPVTVRRVFETPRASWQDPESGKFNAVGGTEDLPWCDRVMKDKILERAGWPKIGKMKYPFLMDTSIFCQHIDNNGFKYPGTSYKLTKQYKGSKLEQLEKNPEKYKIVRTAGSMVESKI